MRINVKKCFFIGSEKIKNDFFSKSQELGVIEFFGSHKSSNFSEDMLSLVEAIRILNRLEEIVGFQEKTKDIPYNTFILADKVVKNKKRIEELESEIKALDKDIARVIPLGDFVFKDIETLSKNLKKSFRFFSYKNLPSTNNDFPDNFIYITSAHKLNYYLAIGLDSEVPEGFSEIKVVASYKELQKKQQYLQEEVLSLKSELKGFIAYKEDIKNTFHELYNNFSLQEGIAQSESCLKNHLFFVYGCIPENKITLIQSFGEQEGVYIDETEIHENDKVPTYLENTGVSRLGEDLVDIYDTPSPRDKDPSSWVFGFFALFFSMIVNDAGYGLVFLLTTAFLFIRLKNNTILFKQGLRRFLSLTAILSCTCIIWGLCNSSFFGISLPKNDFFEKFSVLQLAAKEKAKYYMEKKPLAYQELVKEKPEIEKAKDVSEFLEMVTPKRDPKQESIPYDSFKENIFMELSLFIGAIHLILALLRYLRINYSGLGWVFFIIGGYLFFPTYLHSISLIHYLFHVPYLLGGQIGLFLISFGILLAIILAILQKKLGGIGEISQIVQVFSDVLSYLRIYALALAGTMMAVTFNNVSSNLPWVLGFIVLIFGHSINIALAIMGGVIHGLRLNFIEWYHYSFEGGGHKFKPLSKIN